MRKKVVTIVGAGPGIGNHVAEKFGNGNFRVVLISRDQQKLEKYAEELEAKNIETLTVAADAADSDSLTAAFKKIKDQVGVIDVLVYNAAKLVPKKPSELSSQELMDFYQVDVASALHCVQQVLPEQIDQKEGTIIFTGGGFAMYPSAEFSTVSIDKAALRNLALVLAEELKEKGVFVGIVNIMGTVAPETHFAPDLIAEKYLEMYKDRKDSEVFYK
ncbi:SDR family NAD(P)-dependent oxidoreductase [Enterococcus sp. 669A]|uniref:SDR family NAD(P)-dependent oxidoreductase n=1 Tax=Candidatus Enterococcus moelleringii TaxID=2815325 RepID=A0ABS3LCG0_9ENTE|nr:SDR family NAD(P)-dependent oxidoreductase [Enterococcus sp. 669A]MBO1307314.1 SDR family NAD(P)-dependent oxidoreductase [Enterococcus sp. 669A]